MNNSSFNCVAFADGRCIARGDHLETALAVKAAIERESGGPIIVIDATTSERVELDLRGNADDIRQRYAKPQMAPEAASEIEQPVAKAGRGRPKLGVTAREVTLLPRHWAWLDEHPSGASARLRMLVETAMRASTDSDRRRKAMESVERFMNAVAGNLPGYEEVSRAFYTGRIARMEELAANWPVDVRKHLFKLVAASLPRAVE